MTGDIATIRYRGLLWLWLVWASFLGLPFRGSHASDTAEPLPLESRQALLMFDAGGHLEFGSGNGPGFPYPSGSPQPASASASAFDSVGSPSLVTARCWNNYQTSDDCRDLNVITDDSQARRPDQEDSIITATLVYDAWGATPSQPVMGETGSSEEEAWLGSSEPAESAASTKPADPEHILPPNSKQVDQHQATDTDSPEMATNPFTVGPVWHVPDQPLAGTVKSPAGEDSFFGTPKPAAAKSSTTSRICRDQNDADCDEAEDDGAGAEAEPDDEADDEEQRAVEDGAEKSNQQPTKTGQLDQDNDPELGSGQGNPDDTEDDGDDDGDGSLGQPDLPAVWNMNSPSSQGSLNLNSLLTTQTSTTPFTLMPHLEPTTTKWPPVTQGAEIEVVVHPMLPPSFPKSTPSVDWASAHTSTTPVEPTQRPQTTTTTTIIPDDTYKSKPVFPSTNRPSLQPDNQPSTEWAATTNDIDLATFKSVPIAPVIEPEPSLQRPNSDSFQTSNSSSNDNQQQVADRHKFEPPFRPIQTLSQAPKFESAWLEKPQRSTHPNNQNPLNNRPAAHEPMASNQQSGIQQPALSIRRSSEMLPTLLVIASVLIFLAAMVVLVMMALWRRNMKRQRALLLSKSGLMNAPGGGALFPVGPAGQHQMVASLHRPVGLLSTYAPSLANKIGTSIVQRTPADDQERLTTFGETGREDGGTGDNSNNSQQTCSTSTDNEETTSSGAGSMATNNQPPVSQAQLDEHPIVAGLRQPNIQHQTASRPPSRQQYIADPMSRPQQGQGLIYPHGGQPMYPVGPDREPFGQAPPPSMQYQQMMPPPEASQMRRMISLSRSVEALDHQYQYEQQQHLQQLSGIPNHNTMRPGRHYQPIAGGPPPAGFAQPNTAYLTSRATDRPFMLPPPELGLPSANHGIMNPSGQAPPGPGRVVHHLNRAPYSTDDSSSFVTISPSLARTSSSSSFVLTNGASAPTIHPKPLVDATGRMFNSYAPAAPHFGSPSDQGASFVSAASRPPDISEPWFV